MRSSSHLARAIVMLLLLVAMAGLLVQCSQPAAGPAQTAAPSLPSGVSSVPPAWKLVWNGHYSEHIQPIFNQRCVSCHGPTRADKQLRLDSYEGVMKGSEGGAVVVSGSPAASVLLSTVDGTATGSSRMPPTGPALNDIEVQNIRIWIGAGAPAD